MRYYSVRAEANDSNLQWQHARGNATKTELIENIYSESEIWTLFLIDLDLDIITEILANSHINVNCLAASVNRHLKQ